MKKYKSLPDGALPANTILKNTYIIQEVLGEGGFGITYSGYHKTTLEHVAIKEYFPSGIARRITKENTYSLLPFSSKSLGDFQKGRIHFLNEAKLLKELKYLDSIVSVYDYFEEGNTAYIVMEYIEGLTLDQYIQENGILHFDELFKLMTPVIQSLTQIHDKGLIHRDISPDNLILGLDNQLHLIDFGAASRENPEKRKKHTVILKAGYAPPEQYVTDGKIGAWIDVYALCATMYFALTGNPPTPAIHRLQQDNLKPLSMLADIQPWQSAAIEKGLQIHPSQRFRSMDELYHALTTPSSIEKNPTIQGGQFSKYMKWKIYCLNRNLLPAKIFLFLSFTGICLLIFSGIRPVPKTLWPVKTSLPVSQITGYTATEGSGYFPSEQPALSAPPELLSMIDVTKDSLKTAKKRLHRLDSNIQITTTYSYSKKVPSGHIISQSVAKETLFTAGKLPSIHLSVSKGKKTVSVSPTVSPLTHARVRKTEPPQKTSKSTGAPTPKPSGNKGKYKVEPEENKYTTIHLD